MSSLKRKLGLIQRDQKTHIFDGENHSGVACLQLIDITEPKIVKFINSSGFQNKDYHVFKFYKRKRMAGLEIKVVDN